MHRWHLVRESVIMFSIPRKSRGTQPDCDELDLLYTALFSVFFRGENLFKDRNSPAR